MSLGLDKPEFRVLLTNCVTLDRGYSVSLCLICKIGIIHLSYKLLWRRSWDKGLEHSMCWITGWLLVVCFSLPEASRSENLRWLCEKSLWRRRPHLGNWKLGFAVTENGWEKSGNKDCGNIAGRGREVTLCQLLSCITKMLTKLGH